jgi:nitroreductase/putative intracellular protease/amidase
MKTVQMWLAQVCVFTIVLVSAVFAGALSAAETWWEESGKMLDYNLTGSSILAVLGDDFDYQELMVIKKHWESLGARVQLVGTARTLSGHVWKVTDKGWDRSETRTVDVDFLLSEVGPGPLDITKYRVLFFPGGNSPKNLIEEDSARVVELVRKSESLGLILAAICHGPLVLSEAGVVGGRTVTGYREIADNLRKAGGNYVIETVAVDGNLVTGNFPYFETFAVKVAESILYKDGAGPSESSVFRTNPVLKNIRERRSVRRFEKADLEDALVEDLIEAACWAPSANNEQPWRFVVVRDTTVKRRIAGTLLDKLGPYYESQGYPLEAARAYWLALFSAPVHVFAFYTESVEEKDEELARIALLHKIHGVSAACENILLAAKALGLGAVWAGAALLAEDEIRNLLDAPPNSRLVSMIALGYPAESPLPPVRKPSYDVLFFERWGGRRGIE